MFPSVSSRHSDFRLTINDHWWCVVTQVTGIPKYSLEDTSLVIGNTAGGTAVFPIPAGSKVFVDVAGLHYNRESHLIQRACSGDLRRATQHGIGMIHTLSDQKGSWVDGIRTFLSRSLGVQGRASDAGNPLAVQVKIRSILPFRNLGFLRRPG